MSDAAAPRPRILLVEDEPAIMESLCFLLGASGFEVHTASRGDEAINAITLQPPALVVLDIMLPGVTGFDVMRHIRATPATATLPVLVLSAKGQESDQQAMAELGANDFVTKPFSNRALIERIRALMASAARQKESGDD